MNHFDFSDDKNDAKSQKVLEELENIDDDCDRNGIILVKLDNAQEAAQYGIEEIPSLVYFEERIPHLYEGNLENENEVLGWLLHQMKHEEIEHVTDEMLDLLMAEHKYVSALFCKYFKTRCVFQPEHKMADFEQWSFDKSFPERN